MEIGGRRVLVCDCGGTMTVDGEAIARACGADAAPRVHRALCRLDIAAFEQALGSGEPLLVACTQESPLFAETAAAAGGDADIAFLDIRERCGWGHEGGQAGAKMAALLAEAAVAVPPTPAVTLESAGKTLVIGGEVALAAAERLAGRLSVTLLLEPACQAMPPAQTAFAIHCGRVVRASGHFGAFQLTVDGFADADPSSRAWLAFGEARDGVSVEADLVLDLSGGTPLFPAPGSRDGYLRPDPGDPLAVERALFDLTDMVGTFDKPRYIAFDAGLCAHQRSRITGCTLCLDVCPVSAIAPAGDAVAIDAAICAGCGGCESVCPTGAAAYAHPPTGVLIERLRALLSTFHRAGGTAPAVLFHDSDEGAALLAAIGRFGRGLPARLLPVAVNQATALAPDVLLSALAYGATHVLVLVDARNPEARGGLAAAVGLCETIMAGLGYGTGRVAVLDERDPDALEAALWERAEAAPLVPASIAAMGGKRDRAFLALAHLHEHAPQPVEVLALAPGAPWGLVHVDKDRCTLCLACVGACPTGALTDNPERPQLGFTETACIQCGLCRATCPEDAVTLEPRLVFTTAARERVVLNDEEPFACVRCGKPFGVASTVERIAAQLVDHWMFADDASALDRVRMCADCRVASQFEAPAPMAGPPRPKPRTADDIDE